MEQEIQQKKNQIWCCHSFRILILLPLSFLVTFVYLEFSIDNSPIYPSMPFQIILMLLPNIPRSTSFVLQWVFQLVLQSTLYFSICQASSFTVYFSETRSVLIL